MKISLLEPLGIPAPVLEEYADKLRAAGHSFTAFDTKTIDEAELLRRIGDSEIAVIANTPLPASVIAAAPNLTLLDVAFTGIDHVGLDACKTKGVAVCNAAGYSTQTVAELAVGLTVAALRFIPEGDATVRGGKTSAGLRGREICGRTVGIVGTGAIGMKTAQLFAAFGAKVIAYSRTERPEMLALGIEYVDLPELMHRSDIVSLHVPSNPKTKGLISRELLAELKPTAVLINCARGAVVDNTALAEALREGKLAGAAIDVFDMEPPIPADYPLLSAPHTVLTPHVAFLSDEAMLRRAEIVFDNIHAWLAGMPKNLCNL